MKPSIRHLPAALIAGTLSLCVVLSSGCKTGETSVSQPDARAERPTYTAAEVAAIRKASDIDARAFAIPGVVSVGIAGTSEDAWIQVLCQDDSLAIHAQQALGDELSGVPIRFDTTDKPTIRPPDPSRQQ
ncbi:MAG: hypothetical protein R2834_03150 [Rhodothermales bacterium]